MVPIVPVILSGGSGERLWPLSRRTYPKQLQNLYSDRSMLIETARNVSGKPFGAPLIVCNEKHRFVVADQFLQNHMEVRSILLEPVGRNTAPSATVAAMILANEMPEAFMLLMTSDHIIGDVEAFHKACFTGAGAAADGALVLFGATPTSSETGYGYIKTGKTISPDYEVFSVEKFEEKPTKQVASDYIADGGYLWNTGFLLCKPQSLLDEMAKYRSDIIDACEHSIRNGRKDLDFYRLDEHYFRSIRSCSIDYELMEKSENAAVVPVDMGWSDVGSWEKLWEALEKDEKGNVFKGDVIARDVTNSYIYSNDQLVVAVGVQDITVVATDDAVLVIPKERSQDLKSIVSEMDDVGRNEHIIGSSFYSPWGHQERIGLKENIQVKRLSIKPGGALSLQKHQCRSEHWVVISGTAEVTVNGQVSTLGPHEGIHIPIGAKHKLRNANDDVPLVVVEVQFGSYLGEDDIERFEDVYGRCR